MVTFKLSLFLSAAAFVSGTEEERISPGRLNEFKILEGHTVTDDHFSALPHEYVCFVVHSMDGSIDGWIDRSIDRNARQDHGVTALCV
mmetsp:Transcript_2852/g.6357  ORF Transcript_2852/g.6357 Transcript_2852/m.6357 type:complete len:88 (-) Transcript_2852:806-1069(-)